MKCNPKNPCMGAYGKCLDVKITNKCNGSCAFCIEKGGLKLGNGTSEKLIQETLKLKDYRKVLILGGEPFLVPEKLSAYVKGIKPHTDEIYITTNGTLFNDTVVRNVAPYITAINISTHHFAEEMNASILGVRASFVKIKEAIRTFHEYGVKCRINCNLMTDGIDTPLKAFLMVAFAHHMGADSIRFAELQNCTTMFTGADKIFRGIASNPFELGCEQQLEYKEFPNVQVVVRTTCGIVNPFKPMPSDEDIFARKGSEGKVMYTNGQVFDSWQKAPEKQQISGKTVKEMISSSPSCHGSSDGCHSPRSSYSGGCYGGSSSSSRGCHSPRGCH